MRRYNVGLKLKFDQHSLFQFRNLLAVRVFLSLCEREVHHEGFFNYFTAAASQANLSEKGRLEPRLAQ